MTGSITDDKKGVVGKKKIEHHKSSTVLSRH
jgi:hypothetical protein